MLVQIPLAAQLFYTDLSSCMTCFGNVNVFNYMSWVKEDRESKLHNELYSMLQKTDADIYCNQCLHFEVLSMRVSWQ
jgi:hypothetical protein